MTNPDVLPFVVAITGASGAVYGVRLIQVLTQLGRETHLTFSPTGLAVMAHELGLRASMEQFDAADFLRQANEIATRLRPSRNEPSPTALPPDRAAALLRFHRHDDYFAPIASGSFRTGGMAICPCSGGTLAAVACGLSGNLIHRAAGVHLKERRPLILAPRETPLSLTHLDNLRRTCELGAIALPAMPGWYQGVECLGDLVDFVVARILDQLGVENALSRRWGEDVPREE